MYWGTCWLRPLLATAAYGVPGIAVSPAWRFVGERCGTLGTVPAVGPFGQAWRIVAIDVRRHLDPVRFVHLQDVRWIQEDGETPDERVVQRLGGAVADGVHGRPHPPSGWVPNNP